jgi:hypothetical protein
MRQRESWLAFLDDIAPPLARTSYALWQRTASQSRGTLAGKAG